MKSYWKVETFAQRRFNKYRRYIIEGGNYYKKEEAIQRQQELEKEVKKMSIFTKIFYKMTISVTEVKLKWI